MTTSIHPLFAVGEFKDGRPYIELQPFPEEPDFPRGVFAFELYPGITPDAAQKIAMYLQRRVFALVHAAEGEKLKPRRVKPRKPITSPTA